MSGGCPRIVGRLLKVPQIPHKWQLPLTHTTDSQRATNPKQAVAGLSVRYSSCQVALSPAQAVTGGNLNFNSYQVAPSLLQEGTQPTQQTPLVHLVQVTKETVPVCPQDTSYVRPLCLEWET